MKTKTPQQRREAADHLGKQTADPAELRSLADVLIQRANALEAQRTRKSLTRPQKGDESISFTNLPDY